MQRNVNLVDLEKMLQNEHLVANIGVDIAENEPIFGQIRFSAGLSIVPQYTHRPRQPGSPEEFRQLQQFAAAALCPAAQASDPAASLFAPVPPEGITGFLFAFSDIVQQNLRRFRVWFCSVQEETS